MAISGHQWPSVTIKGPSETLRGHQKLSSRRAHVASHVRRPLRLLDRDLKHRMRSGRDLIRGGGLHRPVHVATMQELQNLVGRVRAVPVGRGGAPW